MKLKPSLIISAALISAAIVVFGLSLRGGIVRFADRERVVTVRGLCEKEVRANKVTWPIVTNESGNDLPELYARTEATNAQIVDFLRAGGLDSADYSVSPPSVYDRNSDRYASTQPGPRYQLTNVVVVTTDKVGAVLNLIKGQAALMRRGIAVVADNYNYSTTFEYTGLNGVKPAMIAEATANARAAADKFAADSHSKLGKIKTASQGQFSIDNRDQYTPYIKTIRVITYITYYLED